MFGVILHHILGISMLTIQTDDTDASRFAWLYFEVQQYMHPIAVPSFVFLAGLYDYRYPQTTWRGVARKIVLNVLLGCLLKITFLYVEHSDISWLVLNLAVYRIIAFPLGMLEAAIAANGHSLASRAVPAIMCAVAVATQMTCTALNADAGQGAPAGCPPGMISLLSLLLLIQEGGVHGCLV